MLKGGGLLKNNFNTTQVRKQSKRLLSMFKTLPVFVIEYGQAVCRKGEYRQCLNILNLEIVKYIITIPVIMVIMIFNR